MNKCKLVIFLGATYLGGFLTGAKNMAKMLALASQTAPSPLEVIFSYVPDPMYHEGMFNDLKEMGIQLRPYYWKEFSYEEALAMKNLNPHITLPTYNPSLPCYLPEDDMCSFTDCDLWLFVIGDKIPGPLVGLKPFGYVAYDYVVRYIPLISKEMIDRHIYNVRLAQFVLCTTPQTRQDCIDFVGMPPDRVLLSPIEFEICNSEVNASFQTSAYPYFLWITNSSPHKNHFNVLEAIYHYKTVLKGKLDCCIVGQDSIHFSTERPLASNRQWPHIINVRRFIEERNMQSFLKFLGYPNDWEYKMVLKNTQFLLHGNIYDNGSFGVLEATYFQVPTLSTDYPQMRFSNEKFQLNLLFCDRDDPIDIANKLKEMEESVAYRKTLLPSTEFLDQFQWPKVAMEFYQLIARFIP